MTKTTYIYYPNGAVEQTFINCIWHLSETDFRERKEIILPKGTVEIIFNFSDKIDYCCPSLHASKTLPKVFINGINFKPFELNKTGKQDFLGIQIKSIGLRLLFNLSAKEFNNCVYDGKDICSCLDRLADELFYKQSFNQQVETILKWIRSKISVSNKQYQIDRFQKLTKYNYTYNVSVKKLSDEICLSDRQLRRFSLDWIGMNIEEFIQYKKYLTSLSLLHNTNKPLTQIGMIAGYYDQSHFIREFKSFTEMTPKKYRKANKELPGHIFI